jgi:hypothetical protein
MCDDWPTVTPSGVIYDAPTTVNELRSFLAIYLNAVELDLPPSEFPPNPTWDMVSMLFNVLHSLELDLQNRSQMIHTKRYPSVNQRLHRPELALYQNLTPQSIHHFGLNARYVPLNAMS